LGQTGTGTDWNSSSESRLDLPMSWSPMSACVEIVDRLIFMERDAIDSKEKPLTSVRGVAGGFNVNPQEHSYKVAKHFNLNAIRARAISGFYDRDGGREYDPPCYICGKIHQTSGNPGLLCEDCSACAHLKCLDLENGTGLVVVVVVVSVVVGVRLTNLCCLPHLYLFVWVATVRLVIVSCFATTTTNTTTTTNNHHQQQPTTTINTTTHHPPPTTHHPPLPTTVPEDDWRCPTCHKFHLDKGDVKERNANHPRFLGGPLRKEDKEDNEDNEEIEEDDEAMGIQQEEGEEGSDDSDEEEHDPMYTPKRHGYFAGGAYNISMVMLVDAVAVVGTVYCLLFTVYCLLFTVYCLLCTVYCLLFTDGVYCLCLCVTTTNTCA
jgi:hypothetical protein